MHQRNNINPAPVEASSSNQDSNAGANPLPSAVGTRNKFLSLCLDYTESTVVKVISINLTGLQSDKEIFTKIRDVYLDERGNQFFNRVYKHSGYLSGLRWLIFLPDANYEQFQMEPFSDPGRADFVAGTGTIKDIPPIQCESLRADIASNYHYTEPLHDATKTLVLARAFEFFKHPLRAGSNLIVTNFLPQKLDTPLQRPSLHSRLLVPGLGIYIPDKLKCVEQVVFWCVIGTVLCVILIMVF
ncbi:hypothetical protein VFPPC_17644 [Pochonia chlamydosporia 170]|uniref:Uncharacterized protein n=1 Tax=Pochonia chlamydosporia 170 TaxID=1380566 RepID=A0A219AQY9_METCM|nr:hypothetical protein VFPPC_17644 [Pochonia chlamydosporia 170]OWT43180.1 hypothetical protein VFPPC_17644 [Pochonia chlamydosporia 170]